MNIRIQKAGRTIRSFTKKVWGPSTLRVAWTGRNSADNLVKAGRFAAVVRATDTAGNLSRVRSARITAIN